MPELLLWLFGGAVVLIVVLAVLFVVLGGLKPSKGGSSAFRPGGPGSGSGNDFR